MTTTTPEERAQSLVDRLMLTSVVSLDIESAVRREIESALYDLISFIGHPGVCPRCLRPVIWVAATRSTATIPFSISGTNHYHDCPQKPENGHG